MFVRYTGKTKVMFFKKTDTTHAIRQGGLVCLDDSSNLVPPKNDSTDRVIGVSKLNVTLTDTSSWAGAPMVGVEVPVENAVEWLIDVDSDGGAADSDIGRYCAIDTTGGGSVLAGDSAGMRVDISDTAVRQVFLTGKQSATKVIGVIANSPFSTSKFDTAGNA